MTEESVGRGISRGWAAALVTLMRNQATTQTALNSTTFILHVLIARDNTTPPPDGARGCEIVPGYDAVVSAL